MDQLIIKRVEKLKCGRFYLVVALKQFDLT